MGQLPESTPHPGLKFIFPSLIHNKNWTANGKVCSKFSIDVAKFKKSDHLLQFPNFSQVLLK